MNKKAIMELFDGTEEWTNAFSDRFGERVCIGFDGDYCWHEGTKFEPRSDEIADFWREYNTTGEGAYLIKAAQEEFRCRT